MKLREFSPKQKTVLSWWMPSSPCRDMDAVICDGAVRSGKTMCMFLSFVLWATAFFDGRSFAVCGRTMTSVRRNVFTPYLPLLRELGFTVTERLSGNYADISYAGVTNRFYRFGGRDESSAALIQGVTLAGVMLDEVALMPRSFTEQAMARCSETGSRIWFNCNPADPRHWFYTEWIRKARERNCLYLHFTMDDNPSLSPEVRQRYERLYSGTFYERYVEGKWVGARGLVYPFFDEKLHVGAPEGEPDKYVISCDYGTVNPMSMGLWGRAGGKWYRTDEYYWDSRRDGSQKTDEEYYAALEELAGDRDIDCVIADPSAVSFLECVRRHGRFRAVKAVNDVADGIRRTGEELKSGRLMICPGCADIIREFYLYRWKENAGRDEPRKEYDHAMDDMRYFVSTYLCREQEPFAAVAVRREQR